MNEALERIRHSLSSHHAGVASFLLSLDGVLVAASGLLAINGALSAFQGEELSLFIAGLALIAFGVMIVLRWSLPAVKTGLAGLTAGYFAAALAEFEVATDPCDIGSTIERCAGHVAGGTPWAVYQGPIIVAVLLFFLLALEPIASANRKVDDHRSGEG